MPVFLTVSAGAVAPWIAIGLTLLAMIIAGTLAIARKADRKELAEAIGCMKNLIEEKVGKGECVRIATHSADSERELWKGLDAQKEISAAVRVELAGLKSEVGAYNEQMRALVGKLIEVISNGNKI